MELGDVCNRSVVVVERDEAIVEVARVMREHHVGDVVVVESGDGGRVPTGIITDRDLVVELIAEAVDLDAVRAGDVVGTELVTGRESDSVTDTMKLMRDRGVRRIPVVDTSGHLVGIFTLDDALEFFSEQLHDMVTLISKELRREQRERGAR